MAKILFFVNFRTYFNEKCTSPLQCDRCDQTCSSKHGLEQHINSIHLGLKAKVVLISTRKLMSVYFLLGLESKVC